MPTIDELRDRSAALFTELLAPRATGGPAVTAEAPQRLFRWFDPDDAEEAVALAVALTLSGATAPTVLDGLERALDVARSADLPAGLVAQALAIFVTHNRAARRLAKPRTLRVSPQLFGPSRPAGIAADPATAGPETPLDYWREDPFANEHHEHWHRVYPFAGLPLLRDGLVWAETADRAGLTALFAAADPGQDWFSFLTAATPQEILDRLGTVLPADVPGFVRSLDAAAYRVLFRLNDRQGELFLYMHNQMLARYDAERISVGKGRVEPFDRTAWTTTIADGYDPGPDLPDLTARPANAKLPQPDVTQLVAMQDALDLAVTSGDLVREVGTPLAVTSDALGAATEAAASRLSGLRRQTYPGIHNIGHNMLGRLPDGDGNGVMLFPVVAIRDPVFWRWHKHIDLVNSGWQDSQPAYDFSDAPPVVVRDALAGAADPWTSPDILLLSTAGLAAGADAAGLVAAAVGGAQFDSAVPGGALAGAAGLTVVDELTTRFVDSALSDGRTVTHLTHDPFAIAVRVRNTTARPVPITVRVFAAPVDIADDRTAWMELDKFLVELPANGRTVVYRPDTEFSVVKKPAETDPQSVLDGEADPNDPDYCDCGWPYTLLLPRGTGDGLDLRLAVICTDANRDLVRPSAGCGSMSFCGAVDRYPDTRDMGFPFSRPFAGSIRGTLIALPSAAGRSFVVRHVEA